MTTLNESQRIRFPDPRNANHWGVVAQGGNLSPGVLLSAYEQGIFPWYEEEPITWFSPDPRFVLYLDRFHVSRRLQRAIRSAKLGIRFDEAFDEVITACRFADRARSYGTWITTAMERAYNELHRLGHAHSVGVYEDGVLVGGLYGVVVGDLFAGESMFSKARGESKWALVALAGLLDAVGVPMIDCQSYTKHLAAFGACEVPRDRFLGELATLRGGRAIPRDWSAADGALMLQRGLDLAAQVDAEVSNETRCLQ